ncbi:hypothetical protein FOZ62_005424 [Perkinsus olseni]|uniref:CPW-WPC domain-containing protein n=1 Tax=Perkinsus olseni TaxID=32597 RepID=A0A7J6U8T3_PEROL|nr:hypothetical protein FOZ62_005424 [Perkinsus olseni]
MEILLTLLGILRLAGSTKLKNVAQIAPFEFQAAGRTAFYDPKLAQSLYACKRDYSLPCPEFHTLDGTGACIPQVSGGPCGRYSVNLSLLSRNSKERWAELCRVNWPCEDCSTNFTEPVIGSFSPLA